MLIGEQSICIFAGRGFVSNYQIVYVVCNIIRIAMCRINWGTVYWHFAGRGLASYYPIVYVACYYINKILLVDDFIFLNLSCNFTVNNCILFQVANKPVMTRNLLYSLILELYGWFHS